MISYCRTWTLNLGAALLLGLGATGASQALTLGPDFAANYTAVSLGSVPGLPIRYGGLTFLDNDTVIIGGEANVASGRLYTIDVVRGAGGHITGFAGNATVFGQVGEFNDGGVVFGPGGVLFSSRWPVNELGQTKPGSTDEDKITNMAALGVAQSHAAINFVPAGFGGAGKMKIVSWGGGEFYTVNYQPDGTGTYNILAASQEDLDPTLAGVQNVPGGPEGFVYIGGANANFGINSMLISEYSANTVGAYEVDGDGNPLVNTRRLFMSGLNGAEGATIDPVTGDFLFSTFGGSNQVVAVRGFVIPTAPGPDCGQPGQPACPVPEAGSLPLVALVLTGLLGASLLKGRKA